MLEFGAYLPDQAVYGSAGSAEVNNCLPLTDKSYGPLNSLSSVVDALPSRPLGAMAFRENDGTFHTFCGDVDNLYKLNATSWTEISKTTDVYTSNTSTGWEFEQYGNNVIGCNGHTDDLQSYVMGTSTKFADLAAGTAPKAKHIAVINNFTMVGNTSDAVDGVVPNRVWWSAIDDPTSWPSIGSSAAAQVQSDRQDIPTGGAVQAIIGAVGGADGAIFMEKAIYRVTYEGSPAVFSFKEIERGRGAMAPKSVVNVGPFAAYLGEEGFFLFDGTQSIAIGNQKVDTYFFNDLDFNYVDRITATADPVSKIIFWSYPGAGSVDGQPNRMMMYNWVTQRWADATIETQALFADITAGYTLDELDAFGNMDTITTTLDSRIWISGFLIASAFDADNKLSTFSGGSLPVELITAEFGGNELFQKPNERMYVDGVRPYVDGGTYTVSLMYRDSPSGTLLTDGPSTVDANGLAHFTRSCRYARVKVEIAANTLWKHAQGIDIDADPDGEY